MGIEKIISKNVRDLREKLGISQRRLSELTGIDVRQLSKLENRPGPITTRTIERLAEALEVAPKDLLDGNIKTPQKPKVPKSMQKGFLEAINVLKDHLGNTK